MEQSFQFDPLEGVPKFSDLQHVARIQVFTAGGFEGTCYWRSFDEARHNPLGLISTNPAKVRAKEEVVLEKAQRARKRVRYICREIGATHLLTLTTREKTNDPASLLKRFERFIELYRKALRADGESGQIRYVAVPEPHPSNPDHWHVHAAIAGRIHVNVARAVWWSVCGGRGMGNIDARFIRCRSGADRALKVARYISKYVTKTFAESSDLDGSHRYRASRITLQVRRVLVFEATSVLHALDVLLLKMSWERGDIQVLFFEDGSGFWFSSSGNHAAQPPPF